MTEIAVKIIKTTIERSPGVGEGNIQGGRARAINAWVDQDVELVGRLRRLHLE